MFDPARHAALTTSAWDPDVARAAIQEIVDDAVGRFDPDTYWPSHPQDDDDLPDGNASPYIGAAGVLWALDFLKREGAAEHTLDVGAQLPRLLETVRQQYAFTARLSKIDPRSPAWDAAPL